MNILVQYYENVCTDNHWFTVHIVQWLQSIQGVGASDGDRKGTSQSDGSGTNEV